MRQHTSRITGSLSVSGSGNVDFTSVKSGVSGSFRLSDIKASLPTGTVSSSAQIDAQISASFAQSSAVSASFALKKAVTGSFALKKAVTGSFGLKTAISESFALKATISGSYLGQGVVTSSAQIATDISGSLGANASLIRSLTATGVSGSFPLKTDISGSFTSLSSSLASRIAAEEAEAEGTVVSSSAQIATDISGSLGANASLIRSLTAVGITGSFIALSASITTRIAAEEAEAEGTVVSSSAQIAADISGSLGSNATLIRSLTAVGVSGSLGANASLIRSLTATAISGSVVAGVSGSALSTGSFGKLEVGGNSSLAGDLTVGGRLTAQEFHTEFVSSSIMFQSGSTKFGDSAADTHTFTGKMEISGSQAKVSASVGATGSFGHLFLAKGGHVTDRLYFSDVGGEYISGDGTDLNITSGNDINIPADIGLTFGDDGEKIEGNGTRLSISSGTGLVLDSEGDIEINADGGDIDFKDDTAPLLKISATAISGSITSTGSFGSIYVDKNINASAFVGDGSAISGLISAADISGSLGTNAALIRSLTATTITGSSAAKATPGFSIAMSVAL